MSFFLSQAAYKFHFIMVNTRLIQLLFVSWGTLIISFQKQITRKNNYIVKIISRPCLQSSEIDVIVDGEIKSTVDFSETKLTTTTNKEQINRSFWILNFVALLWGTQHLVIKDAVLAYPSPALLNSARFLLTSLCFLPAALINRNPVLMSNSKTPAQNVVVRAGIESGIYIFLGFAFQAIGLETTSASRSAFLLYLNVKLVPFFASVLYGRIISAKTWGSALLALVGTCLLSTDGGPINTGDLWCIAAAASSALFILRLETFTNTPSMDEAQLNGVCSTVVTLLCLVWLGSDFASALQETSATAVELLNQWTNVLIQDPLPPLYLGIVISGLCGYLQTLGQRDVPAERAAIIFSLDPVYAAGFSWLFAGQGLGLQGWIGSAFIMSGVWLSSRSSSSDSTSKQK